MGKVDANNFMRNVSNTPACEKRTYQKATKAEKADDSGELVPKKKGGAGGGRKSHG